jgi:methyl-accepting chemotaxis protein
MSPDHSSSDLPRPRIGIATKAILLIAGLGLMSAVANWFCIQSVDRLGHLNNTLAREVAPSRLALSEAKGAMQALGLATYKTFAATERDAAREVGASIKGEYEAARNSLNNVLVYFPGRSDDVNRILRKLELVTSIAEEVRVAVLAGDRRDAQQILDLKFDAAQDDAVGQMNRVINILGGEASTALAEAEEQQNWTLKAVLIVLVSGTFLTLVVAIGLTELSVARPLRRLAQVMTRMSSGDFNVVIDGIERSDEIGAMAHAVGVFRENGLALSEAEQRRLQEGEKAAAEKQRALAAVADAFESEILSVAAALARSAAELESSAQSMSAVAEESGRHAGAAATIADETTETAGTVAAAVDELSTTMTSIEGQVANAAEVVVEATRRAEVAVANAAGLETAIRDVDQIATMINAIASQTNLLALNATIEAARAGEAGRGFAVVAQEVKSLAAQTTRALADIKDKTGSVGQIIDGVQVATQAISNVITRIEAISSAITGSIEQQNTATGRIAATVDGAARRTRQVSSTIAGVSEFASRTRQGAQQILHSVAELNRQAAALQTDAQQFASRVRAA